MTKAYSQKEVARRIAELEAVASRRSEAEYARLVGIPLTSYRQWKAGKTRIPLEAAAQIAGHAGRSIDWLLTGDEPVMAPIAPGHRGGLAVCAEVECGSFQAKDLNDVDEKRTLRIGKMLAAGGPCFAVEAAGGSMEPTIIAGDVLVFSGHPKTSLAPEGISQGSVVCARIDSGATIKRLFRGEGYLELKPDSQKLSAWFCDLEKKTVKRGKETEDFSELRIVGVLQALIRESV